MADITDSRRQPNSDRGRAAAYSGPPRARPAEAGVDLLFLRDEELRQGIELLYFAYRDFTADPDDILAEYGFGRAHHRAIHFINRRPNMTVAELLGILRITKQSLGRVLKELTAKGYVAKAPGDDDARKRYLSLTPKGAALEQRLSESQRARVRRAYKAAGPEAVAGFRRVLEALIRDEDRDVVRDAIARP